MLSNYRIGIDAKVNILDTKGMLEQYMRKTDALIAELHLQIKQFQSFSNAVDKDKNSYKSVMIES
jgi:hypothetical protein